MLGAHVCVFIQCIQMLAFVVLCCFFFSDEFVQLFPSPPFAEAMSRARVRPRLLQHLLLPVSFMRELCGSSFD